MLNELPHMKDAAMRSACKDKIESLEHWLRRLIDDTLTPVYGDYFSYKDANENRVISAKLSAQVDERRANEPSRYPRKIDAVLLDDAIGIICKRDLYDKHFKPALKEAFPLGVEEARVFLLRLSAPRNNLAHANPISIRQAEQIICYSNDVIDSLKSYYQATGKQQQYNVPLILKVTDSFGNVYTRSDGNIFLEGMRISYLDEPRYFLRPGDQVSVEVEVDPTFSPDSYKVEWDTSGVLRNLTSGPKIVIPISIAQVSTLYAVNCYVTSKKSWHRLGAGWDDTLVLYFKVLPPLED